MGVGSFHDNEFLDIQAVRESSMFDKCVLTKPVFSGSDTQGLPETTISTSFPIPCGFQATGTDEVGEVTELGRIDAMVRLPRSALPDIQSDGSLILTERKGLPITEETYEIVGDPKLGKTQIIVKVRRKE